MNTRRIIFWSVFLIIIALIIWGLAVAINKGANGNSINIDAPAVTEEDNVKGSKEAPVTIIEYSDFQCPACRDYYYLVKKLLEEESTSTVRFVYRHFPLNGRLPDGTIQHPNALPAALAAEAAGAQGKFWEMYDIIFDNYDNWTKLANANPKFVEYANELHLDINKFKSDLGSTTLIEKINRQKSEGVTIGIEGTPSFFVNGKYITNPTSYEQFKTIIDEASKNTKY